MIAHLDCIPCLCEKTVKAVRAATEDPVLQDAILGEALFHLAMRDPSLPPHELAADLQALIAARTGHAVPLLGDNPLCPHDA
jgi:hypothetical protein